jgi:hypothetical protein
MIVTLIDFEKRTKEINLYFKHLQLLDIENAKIYLENRPRKKYFKANIELIKVLKANTFLLLYNLVESSIKQSITEIYDSITNDNLTYDEVIDEIKKIYIKENHASFKNLGIDNIFRTINSLSTEIIDIQFNSDKIISGNIDGRKVREFAAIYGFSDRSHIRANNGNKLHIVKLQRNNLAHGNVSFAECGRTYSTEEIEIIKNEVILFLRSILKNIDKFIDSKKYKT